MKLLAVVHNNKKFHLKYIVSFSDKTEESSTVYNESQPVQITSPGRYWILIIINYLFIHLCYTLVFKNANFYMFVFILPSMKPRKR